MVQTVILESTVISYLAANPSRDVIVLANQQMTAEWWQTAEAKFDLFASQLVVFEAGAGDPSAAARRLKFLADVQLLDATVEAERLTESLLNAGIVPRKAAADAAHIAFAGTHGVEYLVTWKVFRPSPVMSSVTCLNRIQDRRSPRRLLPWLAVPLCLGLCC